MLRFEVTAAEGNSGPFAEEGFTNPLSLWAARKRNHVSGHRQIC